MVDKDRHSKTFIHVRHPIIAFTYVFEREECDALTIPCIEENVFDPSVFSVVKFCIH